MRSGNALRTVGAALLVVLLGGCSDVSPRMPLRDHRHYGPRMASVDLNNADRRELSRLPNITDQDVDRIIKNRPYHSKRDLVDRNIIGPKTFDEIQKHVYIGGSRSSES